VIDVKLIFVVILEQNDLDNHDINVTDENIELEAFEEKVLRDYLNWSKKELIALNEDELYKCSDHFDLTDDFLNSLDAAINEVDVLM